MMPVRVYVLRSLGGNRVEKIIVLLYTTRYQLARQIRLYAFCGALYMPVGRGRLNVSDLSDVANIATILSAPAIVASVMSSVYKILDERL